MRRVQTIPKVAALFAGLKDSCRFVNIPWTIYKIQDNSLFVACKLAFSVRKYGWKPEYSDNLSEPHNKLKKTPIENFRLPIRDRYECAGLASGLQNQALQKSSWQFS